MLRELITTMLGDGASCWQKSNLADACEIPSPPSLQPPTSQCCNLELPASLAPARIRAPHAILKQTTPRALLRSLSTIAVCRLSWASVCSIKFASTRRPTYIVLPIDPNGSRVQTPDNATSFDRLCYSLLKIYAIASFSCCSPIPTCVRIRCSKTLKAAMSQSLSTL